MNKGRFFELFDNLDDFTDREALDRLIEFKREVDEFVDYATEWYSKGDYCEELAELKFRWFGEV